MNNSARHTSGNEREGRINGALSTVIMHVFWGLVVAGVNSACGYQFTVAGSGPTIGGPTGSAQVRPTQDVSTRLAIQTFENTSFEPNLGLKYTEYFQREFAAGSGSRVVSGTGAADFLLRGTIESVSVPSLTFTRSATFESRAVVTVRVTVQDLRSKAVIWTQRATGSSEFFITDDLQFNRVLQRRAVEQAGEQVAGSLAARFLAHRESTAGSPHAGAPSRAVDSAGSDDPPRRP